MKAPLIRVAVGLTLIGLVAGMNLGSARADGTSTYVTLTPPAIPGVAQLPGPVAAAATPATNIGALTITPQKGVTGTPVMIGGAGLQPNTALTLTWTTSNATWVVDPQPATVDYHGRSVTPVTVEIGHVTTDANGAFTFQYKAPNDFGGIHDIYAVANGAQVAHGGFLIGRSLTISPKSGPIGTRITITYRGLGSSLYEGAASLLYDSHFAGEMTANWTRGTAKVVIRAAGSVGKHVIQVGDAVSFVYMNLPQSPIPWAKGFTRVFTVTGDNGPPKPSLDWPAKVTPTLSERTTMQVVAGATDGSSVHMALKAVAAPVKSLVPVSASGFTSNAPVSLEWATVVGNRVNCKGQCWSLVSQTVGEGTPSNGSFSGQMRVPDGLGGWHVVQMVQNGKAIAQQPFFVKQSIVGKGVSSIVVKEGQHFTVHMKGIGWTQLDNTRAVDYDNSYVGYGCGFNSNGDVVFNLYATGGPGTHIIDFYPLLYNSQPSYANTPYGMIPMLTYAKDLPGLAVGYQLPAARVAITVVN